MKYWRTRVTARVPVMFSLDGYLYRCDILLTKRCRISRMGQECEADMLAQLRKLSPIALGMRKCIRFFSASLRVVDFYAANAFDSIEYKYACVAVETPVDPEKALPSYSEIYSKFSIIFGQPPHTISTNYRVSCVKLLWAIVLAIEGRRW